MDDLLTEFLTETAESIDVVDVELVELEQDPSNKSVLDNIFRLVHTIKGTCGFLGLPRLESVAHSGENVLGKFRDGELEVTPDAVTLILAALDRIKEILAGLEENQEEPAGDDSDIIGRLNAMAAGEAAPAAGAEAPAAAPAAVEEVAAAETPAADGEPVMGDAIVSSVGTIPGEVTLDELEAAFQSAPGPDEANEAEEAPAEEAAAPEEAPAPEEVAEETPAAVADEKPDEKKPEAAKKESNLANQSIRVSVQVLEDLMNMVSELVLTRNQLMQLMRKSGDNEFTVPLQRLSQCTSELQEGVMKTRMQPIGNAWSKLPRIVRDLQMELGKKVDLQMLGADTELDRQVLELIKDPLTHMVRNSADHGVEMPDIRVAAGKPETGTIRLNAYHEGGHIIIEITDDGAGLPVEKLRAKALDCGIASEAELAEMSDQQIQRFIFHAGFSTAEKVTSVSGRGVGMDVVRSNIEKIGGTVDLQSTEGKGTCFKIKIPLTLAIVSALVVACGKEKFAIPQISVLELVRACQDTDHSIEYVNETPVLRLRDRLLPLVYLRDILGFAPDEAEIEAEVEVNAEVKIEVKPEPVVEEVAVDAAPEGEAENSEQPVAEETAEPVVEGVVEVAAEEVAEDNVTELNVKETAEDYIVISQVGSFTFGIVVDQVFDTEEIVVKPVAPLLRDMEIYSGNTILGDGKVIMILDPNGIANQTGTGVGDSGEEDTFGESEKVAVTQGPEKEAILIFNVGDETPHAVPLALVARLEEIEVADIETSDGKPVVQYRDQLMPLTMLNDSYKLKTEGRQPVLVFNDNGRAMGIAVEEIVDVLEAELNIELSASGDGKLGTAVINDKATEVIDVAYYLEKVFGNWSLTSRGDASGENAPHVLLVDDSTFFLHMMRPLLTTAGYQVTAVKNAKEALALRDKGIVFDTIISDIEMPDMNGFSFAEEVRGGGGDWQNIPMVALSSSTRPEDYTRGREVGFNDYVEKRDRETLLKAISEQVANKKNAA